MWQKSKEFIKMCSGWIMFTDVLIDMNTTHIMHMCIGNMTYIKWNQNCFSFKPLRADWKCLYTNHLLEVVWVALAWWYSPASLRFSKYKILFFFFFSCKKKNILEGERKISFWSLQQNSWTTCCLQELSISTQMTLVWPLNTAFIKDTRHAGRAQNTALNSWQHRLCYAAYGLLITS